MVGWARVWGAAEPIDWRDVVIWLAVFCLRQAPASIGPPPNYMLCASEVGICRTVFGVFLLFTVIMTKF